MGRYDKQDTTSAFDACVLGVYSTKMTDSKTGKEVKGYGYSKKESEKAAEEKMLEK
jgi:hypothetical protein